MNNMRKQGSAKKRGGTGPSGERAAVRKMAAAVGDFIRYWGFRRIHGQIWTVLYLSREPLSGTELTARLGVSKALVSPALAELEHFGLILPAGGDGKTRLYAADPQVFAVIRKVLETRERRLIAEARRCFERLPAPGSTLETERVRSLGEMIAAAGTAVELAILSATDRGFTGWQESAEAR